MAYPPDKPSNRYSTIAGCQVSLCRGNLRKAGSASGSPSIAPNSLPNETVKKRLRCNLTMASNTVQLQNHRRAPCRPVRSVVKPLRLASIL